MKLIYLHVAIGGELEVENFEFVELKYKSGSSPY